MEIKLTGWKALLVVIALVGFLGFRYVTAVQALDTEGREMIEQWIAAEYQRYHLARTDISDEEKVALLLQTQSIELTSLQARGQPKHMSVRVEIAPNAAHPPGSPYVRYFRMDHSMTAGWRHRGDISELRYHLTSLW